MRSRWIFIAFLLSGLIFAAAIDRQGHTHCSLLIRSRSHSGRPETATVNSGRIEIIQCFRYCPICGEGLWPLLLILVCGFFFVAKLQARFAPSGLDFAARKAVLFLWLLGLVGAATLRNAYAACLFLGALGYAALLLMPPRRWFWRVLNLVLLLGAAVPFLALVVSFGVEIFLGWRILWYLVLQAAYGVWSPYSVCVFFLATAVWCRLVRLSVLESSAVNSRSRVCAIR